MSWYQTNIPVDMIQLKLLKKFKYGKWSPLFERLKIKLLLLVFYHSKIHNNEHFLRMIFVNIFSIGKRTKKWPIFKNDN